MQSTQDLPIQTKDDKQMRSVFVGNIPYDSNEDEIKAIFTKIGPVLSFRIVYDRDTGKAKGYGFCEFHDVETAQSAIRNLNGYEFRNRTLRVDSAVNEKGKEELRDLKIGEMPIYGQSVPGETAADSINKVISKMPPEELMEFLQQMKESIHNNPAESREMLIRNPQLGYALMRALSIMKFIDEKEASQMILSDLKLGDPQSANALIGKDERTLHEVPREQYSLPHNIERPPEFLPKIPPKIGDQALHYPVVSSSEYNRVAVHREGPEYYDAREREFHKISPASTNQPYDDDRYQFERSRPRVPPNYDQLHMEYQGAHPYRDQRGSRSRDRDRSSSPKNSRYYEQRESRNFPRPPNMQYDHRMPYNKSVGHLSEFNRDRRDPKYHTGGPLPPYPADPPKHRRRGFY